MSLLAIARREKPLMWHKALLELKTIGSIDRQNECDHFRPLILVLAVSLIHLQEQI